MTAEERARELAREIVIAWWRSLDISEELRDALDDEPPRLIDAIAAALAAQSPPLINEATAFDIISVAFGDRGHVVDGIRRAAQAIMLVLEHRRNLVTAPSSSSEGGAGLSLGQEAQAELERAQALFPPFNGPHEGWAVIAEEFNKELWDEVCASKPGADRTAMRKEAIQVAAMALRFVHDCCDHPAAPPAPLVSREHPQEAVRRFHEAFGVALGGSWAKPSRRALRRRLISEEFTEYLEAEQHDDATATLDALVDMVYVIVGAALEYEMDFAGAFDAVQAANMAKLGPDGKPIMREDGKVLKPEGWRPADLTPFVLFRGRGA